MGDLISRSQLLKEIETWGGCVEALHEYIQIMPTAYDINKVVEELNRIRAKKTCNKEKCDTKEICRICVVDDAIEIVKQEAEQYNNDWISCSERLPKYGEVVMCSCTNSGITISCITHKGVKPSKSVRFGQHSVIAWQPLPQPYQPKGE